MDLSAALDQAIEAARLAGAFLRADFHRPGGARGSGDKADADVEAEREIRRRLRARFPGWSYRGEETGAELERPGAPTWLVDPNDGTRDYLLGRRGSAVSIALVAEGRPVLGVVFAFAYPDGEGDLFCWAEGCGPLRRNGRELTVSLPERLSSLDTLLVSAGGDSDTATNLRCAAPARFRTITSIAHRLALVAAGEAAATASLYAPCGWDYAGGHALLRGSGGVLVDESGAEVTYDAAGESTTRAAFAGSAAVAAELVRRPWGELQPRSNATPIRLGPGSAVADSGLLARAQGCLLGQLAGDSLGSLVEGHSAARVAASYPAGPRWLEDGGVWDLLAGQPTDDSEMALALGRSILERGGYDPASALAAYRAWRDSGPFDIGQATTAALMGLPMVDSEANGSLMRISPLAVLGHGRSADEVAELARRDSILTHPHPHAADAVAAFAVAAAHAVCHGDGPEAALEAALAWAAREAREPIRETLEAARRRGGSRRSAMANRRGGSGSLCTTRSTKPCTRRASRTAWSPRCVAVATPTPTRRSRGRCSAPATAGPPSRSSGGWRS